MAKIVQDPPILTPMSDGDLKVSTTWKSFFQQLADYANKTFSAQAQSARVVSALTPGASPWVYQSPFAGDVRLLVSGGTVSALQFSRDGTTFYSLGVVAGQITLSQNDFLKVTYTVAPAVTAVPA